MTMTTTTTWHVGDRVRTNDNVRPQRYSGRTGTVAEVRRVSPTAVEVGVLVHGSVSWFAPAELEAR
jgi:ribosomal protein L21E